MAARDEVRGRHQKDHPLVSGQQTLVAGDRLRRVSELLQENVQRVNIDDQKERCGALFAWGNFMSLRKRVDVQQKWTIKGKHIMFALIAVIV